MQRLIGSIGVVFGGFTWTPVGREFVKAVFWDRVVHVMNPILDPALSLAMDYGPGLLVICIGLYFLIGRDKIARTIGWARVKLNIWVILAVISGIACIGFVIAYFIDLSRGPVVWKFGASSPINTWMNTTDKVLWVEGFHITGQNRWNDPISPTRAFIRSDLNSRTIKLGIPNAQGIPADVAEFSIPGEAQILLRASFTSSDPALHSGISLNEFRTEFGRFTFFFEWDGGSYKKQFREADVDHFVQLADQKNRDARELASQQVPNRNGAVPKSR
jgi:hypothetical protein